MSARQNYIFQADDAAGKTTKLIHEEQIDGLGALLFKFISMGMSIERDFNKMNEEIKARCESIYRA